MGQLCVTVRYQKSVRLRILNISESKKSDTLLMHQNTKLVWMCFQPMTFGLIFWRIHRRTVKTFWIAIQENWKPNELKQTWHGNQSLGSFSWLLLPEKCGFSGNTVWNKQIYFKFRRGNLQYKLSYSILFSSLASNLTAQWGIFFVRGTGSS